MEISGWQIDSNRKGWSDKEILPQPSGQYSFKNEVKEYIVSLVDNMSLGSEIKNKALDFTNNIGFQPARPSTLAACCILMAGSFQGMQFDELLINISKDAGKMKYTLQKWIVYLISGGLFNA